MQYIRKNSPKIGMKPENCDNAKCQSISKKAFCIVI